MSNIWGEISSTIEHGATTIDLEHTYLLPSFFVAGKILHESPISSTRERTLSINGSFSKFKIIEMLWKYADPAAKANELLALEDEEILFTPGTILWSRYCLVTSIEIEHEFIPASYPKCIINLEAKNNVILGGYITTLAGLKLKTKGNQLIRKKIKGIL